MRLPNPKKSGGEEAPVNLLHHCSLPPHATAAAATAFSEVDDQLLALAVDGELQALA